MRKKYKTVYKGYKMDEGISSVKIEIIRLFMSKLVCVLPNQSIIVLVKVVWGDTLLYNTETSCPWAFEDLRLRRRLHQKSIREC